MKKNPDKKHPIDHSLNRIAGKSGKTGIGKTPKMPNLQQQLAMLLSSVYSVPQAAAELGLEDNTIRKYAQDGCFSNAASFGYEWMIPAFDIQWWKDNRKGRVGRPKSQE